MGARTKANISDYSVGIATTSTIVLPAYFGRNFLLIKNNGPGAAAVNLRGGTAVVNTIGNIQLASGQGITFQKNVPQNAITAISASTSQITVQSDDSVTFPNFLLPVSPLPELDLNFSTGQYFLNNTTPTNPTTFLTTFRAGTGATDLLPTSAAGASFTTFAANAPRITSGLGILSEESRINNLLNSNVPATQTTASLGTGTYTLWVNGSGSATASVGTATAAALPLIASQGVPQTFAITVAGTIVVTVAGSLNAFQLELGTYGTSFIITAGATVTRAVDNILLTAPPIAGSVSTFLATGTPLAPAAYSTNQVPVMVSDTTNNNRMTVFRNSADGSIRGLSNIGGVSTIPIGAVWSQNTFGKVAFADANSDQALCFNAGSIVTGAGAWPPASALTEIRLGNQTGLAAAWNGYLSRFVLWPSTRLSNSQLQSITS